MPTTTQNAAETKDEKPGAALRSATTEEDRKRAASLMGSVRSKAKAEAAQLNGKKPKSKVSEGRPVLPLEELTCTCSAGMSLEGHKWDCPRGQAIKRRAKAAKDARTGQPVAV